MIKINEYTLKTLYKGITENLQVKVTQSTIEEFAKISGDYSAVHMSESYAKSKGFPDKIAHGMLLGSYVSALIGNKLPGKHGILQSCELEFRSPLIPPDIVDIAGEVINISESTGQVAIKIIIKNSEGKVLVSGKVKTIVKDPHHNISNGSPFQQLASLMHQKYPNFAAVWDKSREQFGEKWEKEISENIIHVFGSEKNSRWDEAVDGYAEFCTEALRAQIFFEKTGRYKASNYQEVLRECYHSSDYMERRYLPGQYLSHYIWPHHQRMLRHFVEKLLPKIEHDVSLFYEVGVGCGMYSQKTLQILPQARGIAYDISDYALKFTYRVLQSHGLADRYDIRNQDIIANPIEQKADLVISQEVLEHLEDPQAFISALFSVTKPGGWGYISAAVNASHTDHIYLYRSSDEVQQQIENAGWQVCDRQIESNYPDKPVQFRPTIVGFLVLKSL